MTDQQIPPSFQIPTVGELETTHIGEDDLPYVPISDVADLKVLHIDLNKGLWVVKTRLKPGFEIETHYHTGDVFAVTLKGSWFYKEHPEHVNSAGSYLYEPAGSVHTLTVPAGQEGETEIWFAVNGANINIDSNGHVTGMVTASFLLTAYRALCKNMGLSSENVIVIGNETG